MSDLPTITVSLDLDTGTYALLVTNYSMTAPAGPRLFHAPPHPDIQFVHETEAEALRDAGVLRQYIEEFWTQGKQSKAAARKNRESRA